MKKIIIIIIVAFALIGEINAQRIISGHVNDKAQNPLIGASVFWENTTSGVVTNEVGYFEIPVPQGVAADSTLSLIVSYVGYEKMAFPILPNEDKINIVISGITELEEVKIVNKRGDTYTSTLNPRNIEQITGNELRKAPCCNLSESFETNPTVDVQYSDAISGAKEIEMLGLKGNYTQLMIENRPTLGGIATPYAMEYIAGTWMEGIQISKGASTVVNGYESITGQINVELKKPVNAEFFHLNLFASHNGRAEGNVHFNQVLNKKWSTGLLLHADDWKAVHDRNGDTFLDVPAKRQYNALSRWFYNGDKLEGQFNIQGIYEDRSGGQIHTDEHNTSNDLFKFGVTTNRVDAFAKLGYTGFDKIYNNAGSIYSFTTHKQSAFFGGNKYEGAQQTANVNLIYETILGTTSNKLKLGSSFKYDNVKESYNDTHFDRVEKVPGAFAEYTFMSGISPSQASTFLDKTAVVAGLRLDYHNLFGLLATPRLNVKYNFTDDAILRFSAGKGYRTPFVLAENIGLMASNRRFAFNQQLQLEEAWNYGMNFTQNFKIAKKQASIGLDLYRTDFQNQLIVDVLTDASLVQFYNLTGKSYANSFLATFSYELLKGLDIRLAYKLNDVQTTFDGKLERRPLLPKHGGLVNVHYTSPDQSWKINLTSQLIGSQILPKVVGNTAGLPQYRIDQKSPSYQLYNMQISKTINKSFEIYVGAENLGNYRQEQPILGYNNVQFGHIIGSGDPKQPLFDATAVFAPIMGTMGYAGIRYTIQQSPAWKEVAIKTSAQCGMCKEAIEEAFKDMDGLKNVFLDLSTKELKATYNKKQMNEAKIKQIINATGYDADNLPADPTAYEALPACCKKDAKKH